MQFIDKPRVRVPAIQQIISEAVHKAEDALDAVDLDAHDAGASDHFRSYVDKFRTPTGRHQEMSGGGASRMIADYSEDAPAKVSMLVDVYDAVATEMEKARADIAQMKKALAALAGLYLGKSIDMDGSADDRHEDDESTADEEKRDSSAKRKAQRKAESEVDDEEESDAENDGEEEGIKSMSVDAMFDFIASGKAKPPADKRKPPIRNVVKMPPSMLAKSNGLTDLQLAIAREDVLDTLEADERAAYATIKARIEGIQGYRNRMSDIERQLLNRVDSEAVEIAKARI